MIHCLTALWVIVLIIGCIKKKCHKKRLNKLLRKLVRFENKDGTEIYMNLSKGIREVDVKIKTSSIPI